MVNKVTVFELAPPELEFGGTGIFINPREGLREAGPFDLRFGAAHREQIRVGFVGPKSMVNLTKIWLERCSSYIGSHSHGSTQYPDYPGFKEIFRSNLVFDDRHSIDLESSYPRFFGALKIKNDSDRFESVLAIYKDALLELASKEIGKPDIVFCCIPDQVVNDCWSINKSVSKEEKEVANRIKEQKESGQVDWIDSLTSFNDEQIEEYLLTRDFRRAIKAHSMYLRMPVQLLKNDLILEDKGQPLAEKAWNISVGLYYKAGGIPWRLKVKGPETCFVGITFHHFRTSQRHIVRSSIAHAFSTQGEGFALKGQGIPWEQEQGRNVHLTESQASDLGRRILEEYQIRTGGYPIRMVLHKSSKYNEAEQRGFRTSFRDIPVVELINLMPTPFRLVRLGDYPPNRGTVCVLNNKETFLFTTGFMPELGTYPGPHIPAPVKISGVDDIDLVEAAKDIMGLTRMNWNTASITGGTPVTLLFSSRVGGIMDEYGMSDDEVPLSDFRYYM